MVSSTQLATVFFAMVAVSHGQEKAADSKLESKWFGGVRGYGSSYMSFRQSYSYSSFFSGMNLGSTSWLMNNWGGFYGGAGNIFGYCVLPNLYSPLLFAKVADTHSVSRRAISLDSDQLFRRSEDLASCVNQEGATELFVKSDCLSAATKLAEKQLSSASCGMCTLSLVTPKNQIAPKQIPASALEKVADGILKACSTRNHVKRAENSSDSKEDVAMVLSKATSHTAC